jgi:hypothetical protein
VCYQRVNTTPGSVQQGGATVGWIPSLIPLFALFATGLGLWSLAGFFWTHCPVRANWARRVFMVTFGLLAVACLLAAVRWQRAVLPCGLAVAVLFLAVLWPYSSLEWEIREDR